MKTFAPLISSFLFLSISIFAGAHISTDPGVCYGQLGNNLPSPPRSVELIKSLKAKRVKIYDANPKILDALKDTDIQVSVMLPNELIPNISASQTASDSWVNSSVTPFFPATKIRYLLVGNEILSNPNLGTWFNLVPAMRRIKQSLKKFGLKKIKVGTSMAMDVLGSSFPPSSGSFRPDISDRVIKPMLQFLNRTKSFFFLDVYPFFPWSSQPKNIRLQYALFEARNGFYTDPGTNLTYTNLFDQMVDSVYFAMERLGYPDIRIWIAETGWPNAGDIDQIGANIYNAATFNRNFIKKVTSEPPAGTPARPNATLPAFIFALYNENQKPGPGTERHFGLLYPNGTHVYGIDLSGGTPNSEFAPLPKPRNNEPYKGKIWCVVREGANSSAVAAALSYACSQGNGTCDPIQPGKPCFKPDTLVSHATYAFSSYWAQFRNSGGTCNFNGLATPTGKDPSAEISTSVGVCYGQLGDDLPPPPHSTELIKSLKAKRVKIYDADPKILDAFRNTGIQVSIMLPNDLIPNISATQAASDSWVNSNIVPFFPATKIRYLLVGNEILTNPDTGTWSNLVPAMINIRKSLKTFGMKKIKVGTSMAMEVLETTFPPSSGSFRPDISDRVVRPMLQFLNRTKSFFFLDLYPYFYWSSQPKNVSLEYALFEARDGFYYVDPGTNLTYTNLFDQMVDAVVFAMRRLGHPDIRIWIAETGWPSAGDMDQIGANIYNAATYNRNFIKKVTSKPHVGTPARPNSILPSFLFALYNENRKPGPGTERNFGLLHPNGTYVYGIDLSGEASEADYPRLPEAVNNELYKGKIWCVAEEGGNSSLLGAAVSYACSQGKGTCDPIQPGKKCFRPNSVVSQASYAFSSYWARFKKSGGTCYFDGLATQTAEDPSYDGCDFPSVTLV